MDCDISKCKAHCCYNVALPAKMYEKFGDKIVRKPVAVTPTFGDCVQALQHPSKMVEGRHPCPWLREDNRCNIYEDRANICRLWGHSEKTPLLGCKFHGEKEYGCAEETPVYMLLEAPDEVFRLITGEEKPKVDRTIRRYFEKHKEIMMSDFGMR